LLSALRILYTVHILYIADSYAPFSTRLGTFLEYALSDIKLGLLDSASATGIASSDLGIFTSDTEIAPTATGITSSVTGIASSVTGIFTSDTEIAPTATGIPSPATGIASSVTGIFPSDTEKAPTATGIGIILLATWIAPSPTGISASCF
jgi:hypothetical protein